MDEPLNQRFSSTDEPSVADVSGQTRPDPGYDPRARLEYLQSVMPPKKKRGWLKWLLLVLLVLLLAGAAGAYYLRTHNAKAAKTSSSSNPPSAQASTDAKPKPIVTQNYESTNFNLSFDYPETWTVTDKGDGKLTVTSPQMDLKSATGATKTGTIVLTITATGQNLGGFDSGNGTAVRDSEKISYKKPTQVQRAQTYLTFVQYSTTVQTGIDAIFVTGDFGYQKEQAVPKVDMAKLDPVINATFWQCKVDQCNTGVTPLTVPATAWDDAAIKAPIMTIIESLSVN